MPTAILPPTWELAEAATRQPGRTYAFIKDPSGVAAALPLIVHSFQIDRYANRVGAWSMTVAVDNRLDNYGQPVAMNIVAGWTVTLVQEHNSPFGATSTALLTDGVVEQRDYQVADGSASLQLAGSMNAVILTRQQLHGVTSFPAGSSASLIAATLANGRAVTIPPSNRTHLQVDFNGGSRYAGLLKLGELARLTLRENWDGDALEFTPIDGAPDSGWTFTTIEKAGPEVYGG